jgi:tryptophanyl-tRNA synthetase
MTIAKLEPIQKRYREIVGEPGYLDTVLREGAEAVSPVANATVTLVKQRMGIYVPDALD